jgi:hypothetical protein
MNIDQKHTICVQQLLINFENKILAYDLYYQTTQASENNNTL